MDIGKAQAEAIVRNAGWLGLLPEEARDRYLKRAVLQRFGAGETVIRLGDPPGGIYGLVRGTVSVSIAPAGETPRLILFGIPGHWTGETCFLTRHPRRGELRTASDTHLLHIPLDALDAEARDHPETVHHIALMLMMSVEFLLRVVHDLQKPKAEHRIAAILERAAWTGTTPVHVTQAELGIMANASRKQVNAALKRFSDAGWIDVSYRAIVVRDGAGLRRLAKDANDA